MYMYEWCVWLLRKMKDDALFNFWKLYLFNIINIFVE